MYLNTASVGDGTSSSSLNYTINTNGTVEASGKILPYFVGGIKNAAFLYGPPPTVTNFGNFLLKIFVIFFS